MGQCGSKPESQIGSRVFVENVDCGGRGTKCETGPQSRVKLSAETLDIAGGGKKNAAGQTSGFRVHVKTGDRIGSGTKGDVSIAFYNEDGARSRFFKLNKLFKTGELDEIDIPIDDASFGDPVYVELQRECPPVDNWFCEYIKVRCLGSGRVLMFPLHRWVPIGEPLKVKEFDMLLPQDDELIMQRRRELEKKKEMYEAVKHPQMHLLLVSSLSTMTRFPLPHKF